MTSVYSAHLTRERAEELFRDLRVHAREVDVQVKGGAAEYASAAPDDLDAARAALDGGACIQIRYTADGTRWCDTLRPQDAGVLLVRAETAGV